MGQFGCTNVCGTTYTTTRYIAGGVEEVTLAPGTTTTTKYYSAGGLLIGVSVNGTISYLAQDGLGSVSVALSSGGSLTAAQLFAPYGGVRYHSGTMPTARGFTGQYGDAITGLSYYGARYYDPVAGQFTTADTIQGPNRYGYVAGNPTTATDPSGHRFYDGGEGEWQTDDGGYASYDGFNAFSSPEMPQLYSEVNNPFSYAYEPPTDVTPYGADGSSYKLSYSDGSYTIYNPEYGNVWEFDDQGNLTSVNGVPESVLQQEDAGANLENADLRAMGAESAAVNDATPTSDDTNTSSSGTGNTGKGGTGTPGTSGAPGTPAGSGGSGGAGGGGAPPAPDFVVTPGGDVIPVPDGATGPNTLPGTGGPAGVAYDGGSGGNGLHPNVATVRIMNPTDNYPGGYVTYENGRGQPVEPYPFLDRAGMRIRSYGGAWRHIPINNVP